MSTRSPTIFSTRAQLIINSIQDGWFVGKDKALNANIAKYLIVAGSIVMIPLAYFTGPSGDRWFRMGAMAVFAIVLSCMFLPLSALRCPNCRRATDYFDTYSERYSRLSGGHRRFILCRHCYTTIDRLDGSALLQRAPEDGRTISHLGILCLTKLFMLVFGWILLLFGAWSLFAIAWPQSQRVPPNPRIIVISVFCGLPFFVGFTMLVSTWWLKRRIQRLAASRGIRIERGIRIRW
jgi:hypothetical protein